MQHPKSKINPVESMISEAFFQKCGKQEEVLEYARTENYIILTFDKDYGELLFRYAVNLPVPVVFFRYKGADPTFAGNFLIRLLKDDKISFDEHFTVIDEAAVRQRKF